MEHGFLKERSENEKKIKKVEEASFVLPLNKNPLCSFCSNPRIDLEIKQTFNKKVCFDCKFTKLHLITKTAVIGDFLLTSDDIKEAKYLSRPNPKKGTWSDMQLFLLEEIEELTIKKFKSLENMEIEKERRGEMLLERKKKKVRARIKALRRRTLIEKKIETRKHKHSFVVINGESVCECGMVIDQEEI